MQALGKNVIRLTAFQRSQAVANDVLDKQKKSIVKY